MTSWHEGWATLFIRVVDLAIEALQTFVHVDRAYIIYRPDGTRRRAYLARVTTFISPF